MKLIRRLSVLLCLLVISNISGTLPGSTASAGNNGEDRNYTWDVQSDTWVLNDSLGRSTPEYSEAGGTASDKYVLLFYHNWHYDSMRSAVSLDKHAPRNISKILRENSDALTNSSLWGLPETYHYWGEPVWGYYSLRDDEYVIRKHAQMLTDAGVDAIVLDYTNWLADTGIIPYKDDLTKILDVFLEIIQEGGDVPQIVIMATWDYTQACKVVQHFYDQFYSDPRYDSLWFRWKDKPLFLAWDVMVSDELKEYFTLRRPYPFNDTGFSENEWPWNSAYPQKAAYTEDNPAELVTVSVSQTISGYADYEYQIGGGMSVTDQDGYFIASGRSNTSQFKYLTKDPSDPEYHSEAGAAFQESFDRAISLDPDILFITGWNEWVVARFTNPPEWANISSVPEYGVFFDQFCAEYSRDIEPTREGGLGDNFYNQMIINIRRFKGTGKTVEQSASSGISIDGSFDDWADISFEYRDDMYDKADRESKGIGRNVKYVNKTGRNDFKVMKAAYDNEYVYFYAETTNNITPYTDAAWMNLFIRTDKELPGWEGYQYVVNRTGVRENTTVLERSLGGYVWETVNDSIRYAISGCCIELALPVKDIGLNPAEEQISFQFKWHDNMQTEGDFFEFYLNGDSAPNSRFNYQFTGAPVRKDTHVARILIIAASALSAAAVAAVLISYRIKKKKR